MTADEAAIEEMLYQFRRIRDASDCEMRDGDLAREIAERMIEDYEHKACD